MDAPSPTGSESPFHDMEEEEGGTTGDVDGVEMDEPFGGVTPCSSSPEPTEDNRDVEDMELSDDEGPSHQHIIGASPVSRPSPGTPTTPTSLPGGPKTPVHGPSAPANANPLASILSKVDVTAEGILSALSKTPGQPGPSLQGTLQL
ncbi:UNVERIFIED_CONTAM: hypothetical protein FKN15_025519 [Acipenser sinensis]